MQRIIRLVLASSACFMLSGQVWAHAHLKLAEPADQATVSAPSALSLTFSEGLNLKFSGIRVTGPDKQEVRLGNAMLMNTGKTLTVSPSTRLHPGLYQVNWHAVSVDGHKTTGSYNFTVTP